MHQHKDGIESSLKETRVCLLYAEHFTNLSALLFSLSFYIHGFYFFILIAIKL